VVIRTGKYVAAKSRFVWRLVRAQRVCTRQRVP
jgi:hypothetical protein